MEKVWKSNQAFAGNESPGRRLWLDRLSPVDKQEVLSCIRGHKHSVDFFFFFQRRRRTRHSRRKLFFFLRSVGLNVKHDSDWSFLIGRFLLSASRSQLEELHSSSSSFFLFFFILLLCLLLPRRPIEATTGGFYLLFSIFVHFSIFDFLSLDKAPWKKGMSAAVSVHQHREQHSDLKSREAWLVVVEAGQAWNEEKKKKRK